MVRFLIVSAIMLLLGASTSYAQGTPQQCGATVAGHLSMYVGNNSCLADAGGPTSANGTPPNSTNAGTRPSGVGIVNSGQGIALYSGYSSAAYSKFLVGFDGSGNVLLTVGTVGGSTPTCNWNINGVTSVCGTDGFMDKDASNATLPTARVNLFPTPTLGNCLVGTGTDWVSTGCGSAGMNDNASNAVLPDAVANLVGGTKNYGSGALIPFLIGDQTISGAPTSSTTSASFNIIDAVDNVDASAISGSANLMYFLDVPGTSAKGQRSALTSQVALNHTTADGANGNFYTGLSAVASASTNQGGSGGGGSANLVAGAFSTTMSNGATYLLIVEGFEAGVAIDAGASAFYVNGGKISPNGCGIATCNGLSFGGFTADAGRFHTVLDLNAQEMGATDKSVQDAGTLIGAHYPAGIVTPMTAANGVDLRKYSFTGNAFASTGFAVDGAGFVTIGDGTGAPRIKIDGGSSGNGNGPWIGFYYGGVFHNGIGAYSGLVGGAFNNELTLYDGTQSYHLAGLTSKAVLGTDTTGKIVDAGSIGTGVPAFANTLTVWTPTDQSGSGPSITGTDTTFQRIGTTCHVYGTITYGASADGATAAIGGLGCTSRNGSGTIGGGICQSGAGVFYMVQVLNNSSNIEFRKSDGSLATNADLGGQALQCSISYPTT